MNQKQTWRAVRQNHLSGRAAGTPELPVHGPEEETFVIPNRKERRKMGRHSTPRGEASTAQGNGMKDPTDNYQGRHRAEDKVAGSDVPPRDGTDRTRAK